MARSQKNREVERVDLLEKVKQSKVKDDEVTKAVEEMK